MHASNARITALRCKPDPSRPSRADSLACWNDVVSSSQRVKRSREGERSPSVPGVHAPARMDSPGACGGGLWHRGAQCGHAGAAGDECAAKRGGVHARVSDPDDKTGESLLGGSGTDPCIVVAAGHCPEGAARGGGGANVDPRRADVHLPGRSGPAHRFRGWITVT